MNLRRYFFLSILFLMICGCSSSDGGFLGELGGGWFLGEPDESDLDTTIQVNGSDLSGIYGDPFRAAVYVADKLRNKVYVINTDTKSISKSINVGSMPTQMDTTADGSLLLVMHSGAAGVSVIDLDTQTLIDTITLSGLPNSIAVSSNDHLYVAYEGGSADPALEAYNIDSGTAVYSVSEDDAPWGLFVSGRSPDRTRIYIHDQTTSSDVYQWDATNIPPTPMGSEEIASGEPTITPIPGDTRFIISPSGRWEGARFPNEDGNVPLYDAFTLIQAGTLSVQWSAVAVGVSLTGERIAVAHHDELLNPTTSSAERHDPELYDLHVFDADTLVEVDRYLLPDFVYQQGIAYAANGDIYVLLGENVSSSIGVIVP